ncbi:DUF4255 domain-containing protein [Floridanema evergladense]|uniref:DUF4255 domain-containing protein n=1 Tax=Floridaenema evergladense BLCC-F167 TaxID=3153639 RepID=A0ABV4WKD6_9CYAN
MSQYQVVNSVGITLRELLWSEMQPDSTISSLIDEQNIVFEPPYQFISETEPQTNRLSIFLYRVLENSDMKNRNPELINGNSVRYPPLFLNLFYLITPLTNSATNNHHLLAKTMQIFHDNGIVKGALLKDILENTAEELRVIFHPISMEDITKLWSSFLRPYHLSAAYEVKVVAIDSQRTIETETVLRKTIQYSQL